MITYFPFFAWLHLLVKFVQGENIMQPRTKPLIFNSWGSYTNNLWKSTWAIFYIIWSLILPKPYWSSQSSDFFNTLFSKNDFCLDIRHLVDHESHNDIHDDQASIEDENYNHYLKKVVQVITGNSKWRNHSRSPLKSIWTDSKQFYTIVDALDKFYCLKRTGFFPGCWINISTPFKRKLLFLPNLYFWKVCPWF